MTEHLLAGAQRQTKEFESGVYTHGPAAAGPSAAQMTQSFPRGGLTDYHARDELIKQKMEMMDRSGMSKFGQVVATDEDFKRLMQAREKEAEANFDSWVGTNFHKGDVTTRRWLQETYPNYYEIREREMIDRAKRALQVKLLLLRGPKSQKDLILLWGLQTGQISLDRDWDVVGPSTGNQPFQKDEEQKRFKKGLFNPLRYLTDAERNENKKAETKNPFISTNTGQGGGQARRDFYGGAVTEPRYPNFLQGVL